jgi:hypothetical protein
MDVENMVIDIRRDGVKARMNVMEQALRTLQHKAWRSGDDSGIGTAVYVTHLPRAPSPRALPWW